MRSLFLKRDKSASAGKDTVAEAWHTKSVDAVVDFLNSTKAGLSSDEAAHRLSQFGPNRLPEVKARGSLLRFLSQFHNVLIYVLIVAGVITGLLQHWVDAGVIFGVVLVNALIGFVQEGKAENALRAIRQMLSLNAMVMRGGRQQSIRADLLVPGVGVNGRVSTGE